jgi:hypothetical protein
MSELGPKLAEKVARAQVLCSLAFGQLTGQCCCAEYIVMNYVNAEP